MRRLAGLVLTAAAAAAAADCGDLAGDDERLACYDRLAACAGHDDPQVRLQCYQTAGARRAPRPAEPPPSPPSVPGVDADAGPATIAAIATDHRGRRYLTLDNGQIWREVDAGRFEFEQGMTVELRPGIFGSVNLHAPGLDKYVKVRRVE